MNKIQYFYILLLFKECTTYNSRSYNTDGNESIQHKKYF